MLSATWIDVPLNDFKPDLPGAWRVIDRSPNLELIPGSFQEARNTHDDSKSGSARLSRMTALIPREELGRPRGRVMHGTSLYRDTFPVLVELFDQAVQLAADSPEADNPIRAHVDRLAAELVAGGMSDEEAKLRADPVLCRAQRNARQQAGRDGSTRHWRPNGSSESRLRRARSSMTDWSSSPAEPGNLKET